MFESIEQIREYVANKTNKTQEEIITFIQHNYENPQTDMIFERMAFLLERKIEQKSCF